MYKLRSNISKSRNSRYGRKKGSKKRKSKGNNEPLLKKKGNEGEKNTDTDEDSLIKKVSKFMFKRNYPGVMRVQR